MTKLQGREQVYAALKQAIGLQDANQVKELLKHPDLDINFSGDGWPLILHACRWTETKEERDSQILRVLLAHPGIDVNNLDPGWQETALMKACFHGNLKCVIALLQDPRVDVNLSNIENRGALYLACLQGHFAIVHYWLASDREVRLLPDQANGAMTGARETWAGITKETEEGKRLIVRLLREYYRDPNATKLKLASQVKFFVDGKKEQE